MAHVTAKCGTGAGGGVFLTFSDLGVTDVRVTEYDQPSKDNPIDIPYMAGAKNGADDLLRHPQQSARGGAIPPRAVF
jgi:hypothetical protein